jgi:wobble nucleotide-excising tRNase
VAGKRIESVLSEGEQQIHALALFFAELETCDPQVIVFDDPISSFDYNYIGNYCNRLRDLIQAHPNRQIIVLTQLGLLRCNSDNPERIPTESAHGSACP